MDYQQSWQEASTGIRSRADFVRSVYMWLMGGFAVAALGALSAPFVAMALVPVAGRFLGSFVKVGIAIMFFGSLIAAIFHLSALSLIASGVAVIACSAKVLWDTSAMLRTDDLSDPVFFALSLFVSLYNIFISLLNILGRRR